MGVHPAQAVVRCKEHGQARQTTADTCKSLKFRKSQVCGQLSYSAYHCCSQAMCSSTTSCGTTAIQSRCKGLALTQDTIGSAHVNSQIGCLRRQPYAYLNRFKFHIAGLAVRCSERPGKRDNL